MKGETVTILRPGASTTVDVYGNDIPAADARIDLADCLVEPRPEGDANEGGRQGVIIGAFVYVPKTRPTDPRSTDRLEVRGEVHTIEGDPGWWNGAPGGRDTVVVTKRVEG